MTEQAQKSDLIDITATLRHQTEKAYLIDDGGQKIWVPKSHVEHNDDGTFTMPEWLAKHKGLI
jgi:hypothetical protein